MLTTNNVAFVIVADVVGVVAEVKPLCSSFIANSQYINFHFDFGFYLSLILEHAEEGGDNGEKGEGLPLLIVVGSR